jgi:hypothetical protein
MQQVETETDQGDPLDLLELVETNQPLADEQPTEPPRRRRYQRKNRQESPEDEQRSSGDAAQPARRRYVPRAKQPDKIVEREAEAYEAQLAALFLFVGGATSMLLPVTGTTMVLRATQGASAVVEAAKANPRIAAALIALLKVGHYGPLVAFGATLLTAVAVDVGVMPPASPPAQTMLNDVLSRFQTEAPVSPNGYAAQASESSHE